MKNIQHILLLITFRVLQKQKNRIRTKDDTCDLDDGIYFKDNPENVTGTTLQSWVMKALEGIPNTTVTHRKKCITVKHFDENNNEIFNIDYPVFIFDEEKDSHPKFAVKDEDFRIDDPKEFIIEFNRIKDSEGQLVRVSRDLKAWCDNKREKMPSGLPMTVLAMKHLQKNDRDDVALKYTLIEIENALKRDFSCYMPTTPHDNLFRDFDETRKKNFMDNLASFIVDAKAAVDEEKNQLKASRLWQNHFGKKYFPDGKDVQEEAPAAVLLTSTIGTAKPYCENK